MTTPQTPEKRRLPSFEDFIQAVKQKNGDAKAKEAVMLTLRNNIAHYEQKYKMPTAEFIPRYERGEFENSDDYLDFDLLGWYGDYRAVRAYDEGNG
ncbi:hypothetical protein HUU05_26415 [candidate division KSB1 bacterium]|nr:hypothetical protein [candidate division KSB1 bacterium]